MARTFSMLGQALAIVALAAVPLAAQESGGPDARGYVGGFGGAVWAGGSSTASALFEGGARIAPHIMVFTNVGRYKNLQAELQPTLNGDATTLSGDGIGTTGGGSLPAWYGIGGARAEILASKHAFPYVLGGMGGARLEPEPQLMFSGGVMPDGSVPAVGTDITTALVTAGNVAAPSASAAFMFMAGGGVQVPLAQHWAVDAGYRYSRIFADSSLSTAALNTNAVTIGFGYRF